MGKLGTGITILIIALILSITLGFYSYYLNYKFEQVIGSHMENAYSMNTPSRMIEELELAKKAMLNEGLTKDTYGAMFFKKPDNSMDFQYNHIDSILERCIAVEDWYNQVYIKQSGTETLGDVYEQKMDNLRDFIMEDIRSDWIARDAWYIINHPIWYLTAWVWFSIISVLWCVGSGFLLSKAMEY